MDKRKMIAEIKQNYLLKRIRAEEECENFISNLKQDKYFADIYTDYYKKNIEYLKSKYEKENLELKKDILKNSYQYTLIVHLNLFVELKLIMVKEVSQ